MRVLALAIAAAALGLLSGGADAKITYTLHLDGVTSSIANQISSSMATAVNTYNAHGLFKKHINVYYSSSVATAQANYGVKSGAATMTFGGQRTVRTAMHEILHTIGAGTYTYGQMMVNGVWTGAYANAQIAAFDGAGQKLRGDSVHLWPYGLNYDTEDSTTNRFRHVRVMEAVQCDIRSNEESCPVSSIAGDDRRITGRNGGKVMDVAANATGANVQMWDHHGRANQRFDIVNHGGNLYSFRNRATGGAQALDVGGWSTSNGGNVQTWDWSNGTNQKFYVDAVSGTTGWYTLKPSYATNMCVAADGTGNRANLIISSCNGSEDQHWAFHT